MLKELGHIVMAVRDQSACRTFYGGELGLEELGCGSDVQGRTACMFKIGPSILEQRQRTLALRDPNGLRIEIAQAL